MELRKEIETTPSFSRFMLLERDSYTEIIKQIEYYSHTEADTIEHLIDEFDLQPDLIIDTVQSISHHVQSRIDDELEICLGTEADFVDFPLSTYERQLITDMKQTYKTIKQVTKKHFDEFVKRLIIKFKFHPFQHYFEMDEISRNSDDHHTQMKVSIIPLILHMLAAITCLGLSSIFHLFACHSEECHSTLSRLDYGGIVILIGGSTIPPYIYGFY